MTDQKCRTISGVFPKDTSIVSSPTVHLKITPVSSIESSVDFQGSSAIRFADIGHGSGCSHEFQ